MEIEKIINWFKKKESLVYYSILSFIVFIGVFIRTRNISRLKDITTGTWTLGPDADPFLFLRLANYIVEHGKLFAIDPLRYIPLAEICSGIQCLKLDTVTDINFLPYMIAGFHKFLALFSNEITVTYSAIIFPVVMFGLTTIAFFLFARKIFYKESKTIKNAIALISTLFFVLIPSLLFRTIAGIPEKESAGIFFMFLVFYFILEAFTPGKFRKRLIFGILAGIMTALMVLTWGGVLFVFAAIPIFLLLTFFLGKVKKEEFIIYSCWMFISLSSLFFMSDFMRTQNVIYVMGLSIAVFVLIGMSLLIMKINKLRSLRERTKLPTRVFSFIFSILILLVLASIILGPSVALKKVGTVTGGLGSLLIPEEGGISLTIAENRQPYFADDWKNNFGPVVFNIPLFFWMFFIGSVMMFSYLIKRLKKREKIILIFSYSVFLACLIFSRYSPSSILNGVNSLSLIVCFGGILFFLGSLGYVYYKNYKEGDLHLLKNLNLAYILYFILLILCVISARGALRFGMILGAVSSIAVAFLVFKVSEDAIRKEGSKLFIGTLAIIIVIAASFTILVYCQQNKSVAESFAPDMYEFQWQESMNWVRENTNENSVFASWWDYGYWIQTLGERATILDGGNTIGHWNYLMSRHVLTGTDERTALEFLYSHNATYLLMDSTDIGKYGSYSIVGSDKLDRSSRIFAFFMDDTQTKKTNNVTTYIYSGGGSLGEDIIWEEDGQEIFLPSSRTLITEVIISKDIEEEFLQPTAIFVFNEKQYEIPLRFLYRNEELVDFGSGLYAGVSLHTQLTETIEGVNTNSIGLALFINGRAIDSNAIRLYLFNEESDNFVLVHAQENQNIKMLREEGFDFGEFIYYKGLNGPIKIWEIRYPEDIQLNEDYWKVHA